MMTKQPAIVFATVMVILSAAAWSQCDAQSSSRQSTPDPYFTPPKMSVADRYNNAGPYTPPQFGSQQAYVNTTGVQDSTSPSIGWAPPNTGVVVNSTAQPVSNLAVPQSADGWSPPVTPVKTGTLSLNEKPMAAQQQGLTAERFKAAPLGRAWLEKSEPQSSQRSIIRESPIPPTSSQSQFVSNPFIGSKTSSIDSPSSTTGFSTPNPVARGSSFKSIPSNVSTAAAEAMTPIVQQEVPEISNSVPQATPSKSKSFSFGAPSATSQVTAPGNPSGIRVASHSNELIEPAKPSVTRTNVESFELGRVLAVVGGEPIFVGDIIFEANQMIEQRAARAPESEKVKMRKELVKRMLPKYVNEKMLYVSTLQGIPDGVNIEDIIDQASGQFDELELPKMIESSGVRNVAEFEANLRVQGSSVQTLRRSWAKTQIVRSFLSQQLNVNAHVTHRELLDEYRANLADYQVKAKSKWEQIMIRFDKVSSRAEAEKRIKETLDQVVYGGNFAAVAKKVSHGFRADEGGQHDWTTKGSLVLKEVDRAIFSLPIGKVSEVIESRDGFHIIRVIDRSSAGHVPFLEAQVEIKDRLINKKRDEAFDKHLEKLKDEIPVEYYTSS